MALSEADQIELQLLYARYTHSIDEFDAQGWLATWTEPATFDLGRAKYEGATGLRRFLDSYSENGGHHRYRHYTTNIGFREVDGRVIGRAYLMVLDKTTGAMTTTGYYDDVLVPTSAGWRFVQRVLVRDSW